MRWIEFKTTVRYENEGRHKGPVFEAGSRHQFEDAFADRWLRRDVAFIVEGPHVEKVARTRLARAADVQIPEDWRKLKSAEAVELAAALAEPAAKTRNEAFDVIEAELAERAKPPAP